MCSSFRPFKKEICTRTILDNMKMAKWQNGKKSAKTEVDLNEK